MGLESNNHSVFMLRHHLILVTKYRAEVIDDSISAKLQEMFDRIGEKYGISSLEWNYDSDHIHVLIRSEPKSNFSTFINSYKSASSRIIKKEFPHIKNMLWKEYFWSRSFCLATVGDVSLDEMTRYIASQGGATNGRV